MKRAANTGIVAGEPGGYDRLKLRKLAGQLKQPVKPPEIRTGTITSRDADGGLQVNLGYTDELGATTVIAVNALKGLYVGGETVMMIKNGSDWFVIGSFPAANTRSTWTPVLTASTTNPTGYTSDGRYYLHGNVCTAVGQVTFAAAVGSGTYFISLPFAKAQGIRFLGEGHLEISGGAVYNMMAINFDTLDVIRFRYTASPGPNALNWTNTGPAVVTSGTFMNFEIQYEVAIT